MKKRTPAWLVIGILLLVSRLTAQSEFSVQLDTFSLAGLPGLHSFAYAQYDGRLLFLGGRRDGMHDKFDAFNEANANKEIFVVDPERQQVWSVSNNSLPATIKEQLQSANMEFLQDGDRLIFIGGYGYSASQGKYITYPALLSIAVPQLIEAVTNGAAIDPYFQQVRDTFFAVTGGGLEKLGDTYYLVGGHLFDGLYATGWGGDVKQVYTDAIRKFKLDATGATINITDKEEIKDEWNLHRRDYNLVPQIMADGSLGLTIFSGVFQPGQAALPYLNLVNISETGHWPVENFNQYLTQYHTAKLPVFDSRANAMHTFFFGGISQYVADGNGVLKQDNQMPFTKNISQVSRLADGSYRERQLARQMPFYVGTSAEFIVHPTAPRLGHGIIDASKLSADTTFVGYLFGGIQTPDDELTPFVNNNTQVTSASATFFKVSLINQPISTPVVTLPGHFDLHLKLFPNPASERIHADLELPKAGDLRFILQNAQGNILTEWNFRAPTTGKQLFSLELPDLPAGLYFLTANVGGVFLSTQRFIHTNGK